MVRQTRAIRVKKKHNRILYQDKVNYDENGNFDITLSSQKLQSSGINFKAGNRIHLKSFFAPYDKLKYSRKVREQSVFIKSVKDETTIADVNSGIKFHSPLTIVRGHCAWNTYSVPILTNSKTKITPMIKLTKNFTQTRTIKFTGDTTNIDRSIARNCFKGHYFDYSDKTWKYKNLLDVRSAVETKKVLFPVPLVNTKFIMDNFPKNGVYASEIELDVEAQDIGTGLVDFKFKPARVAKPLLSQVIENREVQDHYTMLCFKPKPSFTFNMYTSIGITSVWHSLFPTNQYAYLSIEYDSEREFITVVLY